MCDFQRTKNEYNSKVLIEGWVDNRVMEEEIMKDFLSKRDNGQLMIQKMGSLLKKMGQKSNVSSSSDGFIRFGDKFQLINPGADPNMIRLHRVAPRRPTSISIDASDEMLYFRNELSDPSSCTASFRLNPVARNVFHILSPEKKDGEKLTFGEPFVISTSELLGPPMFIYSDNCEYANKTKHSKHQEICCGSRFGFLCYFQVQHLDPQQRMQHEGCPVKVSSKCIIKHMKSNQALAVESRHMLKTFFGFEHELSAKTFLNDHRAEEDYNYWIFTPMQLDGANVDLHLDTYCHEQEEPDHV